MQASYASRRPSSLLYSPLGTFCSTPTTISFLYSPLAPFCYSYDGHFATFTSRHPFVLLRFALKEASGCCCWWYPDQAFGCLISLRSLGRPLTMSVVFDWVGRRKTHLQFMRPAKRHCSAWYGILCIYHWYIGRVRDIEGKW
jgi:hypothetical protein